MNAFLQTTLTFPTVLWSVLFAFCAIYWLLAAFGILDLDFGDAEPPDSTAATGVLARFGLGGVPLMVALALVTFFGWIISYFVQLLLLGQLSGALRLAGGIVTAVLALAPAVLASSLLLRPLRKFIARLRPAVPPSLLGRVGTVTTPRVDEKDGMAKFDDGGAGLRLQVRARAPDTFKRGDRVVLLEYRDADNTWRVISEARFNR
ncbi:DUF1449 family protein [Lysobacter pythonis]|uniref:DUF1449 family protein n=1 Tax=Solilutibacter pythonis TaxID=2483112 RepID=A0A3M2HSB6_9GAMM|nr:OB-fold-containig protein [Lysobacter pythonis]RMH91145.1 DUF1449 family protein [Lysobacter pythonis]